MKSEKWEMRPKTENATQKSHRLRFFSPFQCNGINEFLVDFYRFRRVVFGFIPLPSPAISRRFSPNVAWINKSYVIFVTLSCVAQQWNTRWQACARVSHRNRYFFRSFLLPIVFWNFRYSIASIFLSFFSVVIPFDSEFFHFSMLSFCLLPLRKWIKIFQSVFFAFSRVFGRSFCILCINYSPIRFNNSSTVTIQRCHRIYISRFWVVVAALLVQKSFRHQTENLLFYFIENTFILCGGVSRKKNWIFFWIVSIVLTRSRRKSYVK